jgi:hypothetical protein
MTAPNIIFPVGMGGSSIVTAADRSRLLALSSAIRQHVGHRPSACWYAVRSQYILGPSCFHLNIAGSLRSLSIIMLPAPQTLLPSTDELAEKVPTGTLILPVADPTDALYLTLFLFDDLALKPAFDPEQIIVPASIRHGLGVFSCR